MFSYLFANLDPNHLIQTFGYLGLFIIIFAESGVLLGFFLPGDSLLFTAGFLASQGWLRIEIITPLVFIAAFGGDSFGYYLGKKLGPKIFSQPKARFFNPENVRRTKEFFTAHGNKTIFLARFIPIIRTFAPMMAGVGDMKYAKFVSYNFLGALIWASGITLAGYLFGNTVPNAEKYITPILIVIVASSLLPPLWQFYNPKFYKNKPK